MLHLKHVKNCKRIEKRSISFDKAFCRNGCPHNKGKITIYRLIRRKLKLWLCCCFFLEKRKSINKNFKGNNGTLKVKRFKDAGVQFSKVTHNLWPELEGCRTSWMVPIGAFWIDLRAKMNKVKKSKSICLRVIDVHRTLHFTPTLFKESRT